MRFEKSRQNIDAMVPLSVVERRGWSSSKTVLH